MKLFWLPYFSATRDATIAGVACVDARGISLFNDQEN